MRSKQSVMPQPLELAGFANMSLVLIGYSACDLTRAAFEAQGHDVWTCDLLPARGTSIKHLQCDIWLALRSQKWDFAVLHPMCTYLTVSAAWAYNDANFDKYPGVGYHMKLKAGTLTGEARREARREALENFAKLLALPFPVVVENPGSSFASTAIRPPSQIVQPYQFGDDASKATGFWLSEGVPLLADTKYCEPRIVDGKKRWSNQTDSGQNKLTPSENRWLERSETYPGIASAMGDQWGRWLNNVA